MWLLDENVFRTMQAGYESVGTIDAEQHLNFEARTGSERSSNSRILSIAGDIAQIDVSGVLTKRPDFFAYLFGGGNTTYDEISRALAQAEVDPEINRIVMDIDSGGGQFDGLFDVIAAMQATTKPIDVVSSGLTASAAFAIASQGDTLRASTKASRIGSVGVVATFRVSEDIVEITSTNAPKKRPNVATQEGVDMVKEELDALHELFVDAIATGRGVSVDKVNADFGQGATLLAEDALKRGMIDAVSGVESAELKTTATSGGGNQEVRVMTPDELKAQHPDTYEAVLELGSTLERDRVEAHLTMGEASGDMTTAIGAINDGLQMTPKLQALYMAASMKKGHIEKRTADTVDTTGVGGGFELTEAEQVAAIIEGDEEV